MRPLFNRNNLLMLFLYLAFLATLTHVEAIMRTVTSTAGCNKCLDEGYTTCRSYYN